MVGVLGAWAVLARVLSRGLPPGIILLGVVLGSLTALTAMGLVLVYRAARVINFAQVAIGSAAATLTLELANIRHWSYWAAAGAGLAFAALLGAAVDLLVIRRFFSVPRLILTLATVGLAQVFAGIELALPGLFDDSRSILGGSMEVPIDFTREVKPILFSGGHFMIMLAVPVVMAGLVYLLKGTAVGRGIRGASENIERARLSGVPVRRLSTGVWVLAALLSTLSAILALPISGSVRGAAGEPTLLLPALAAAVLARMTSLPQAALAAIGLGVLQQAVFWTTGRAGLIDLAYLIVILVGLSLQRDRSTRAESGALSSWVRAGDVPPIPAALRRLPEVVWSRRLVYVAVLGVVLLARGSMSVQQLSLLGTITAVYALVALSLVVLTGWTGQISLGQFAIVGVGAVAAGNLLAEAHADLFLALLGAAAAGLVTSVALGLPALRVRGLFLPVTTLALAVSMSSYFLNPTYVKSGIPAEVGRPVVLGQFDLASEGNLFLFSVAVLAAAVMVVVNLRRRRPGRAWLAVRDNEWAAEARGVSLARTRLAAFAVSGALAGLAGGLHVIALNGVNVGTYAPSLSFEAFSMVVVGGLTSVWGAIFGAIALRYAEYVVSGGLQLIVTGAGVLFLLLVFPGGLGEVGLADPPVRARPHRPPPRDHRRRAAGRRRRLRTRAGRPDARAERPSVALTGYGRRGGAPRYGGAAQRQEVHSDLDEGAAFLSARGLDVAYGSLQVLYGVDFDVRPGEVVALLGTNGAGKSTLVRALSGLTPRPQGDGHLRRARRHRREPRAPRPPRHRPRPGRPGRVPRPHRGGEPAPGHVDLPGRQAAVRGGHRTGLRALPHPPATGGPARRAPLRRPAADADPGPGAGPRPPPAHHRRAVPRPRPGGGGGAARRRVPPEGRRADHDPRGAVRHGGAARGQPGGVPRERDGALLRCRHRAGGARRPAPFGVPRRGRAPDPPSLGPPTGLRHARARCWPAPISRSASGVSPRSTAPA